MNYVDIAWSPIGECTLEAFHTMVSDESTTFFDILNYYSKLMNQSLYWITGTFFNVDINVYSSLYM